MIQLNWTDEQLIEAGLDPKKVQSIANRLAKLSKEMESMQLSVYGASGYGHLMHVSRPTHVDDVADYEAPIADLGTQFDGGDW